MRFRAIEDHRGCWPVSVMCRVFRVSVAGYCTWRARPESERAAENKGLLEDIRKVHAASQGRYGSPRGHAALRARGRSAGRGRIERLMRRHGVRGLLARPRRVCATNSRHAFPVAPNLLEAALGGSPGGKDGEAVHGSSRPASRTRLGLPI